MSFPTTSVLDNFNRANENPLSGGGNWAALSSSVGAMRITSNAATSATSAGLGMSYWTPSNFGPDSEVFCTIAAIGSASTHQVRLMLRVQGEGGANTWDGYMLKYTWVSGASNDTLDLSQVTNNSATSLTTPTQEISAGDSIGLSAVGNILTIYYKASGGSWSSVGTYDITSDGTKYTAAGKVALGMNTNTPSVDDFGGGTVVGGSTTNTTLSCSATSGITGSIKTPGKLLVP